MQESSFDDQPSISSSDFQERVIKAFKLQKGRGQKRLNGRLTDQEMEVFVKLDSDGEKILRDSTERFNLSFRSINRIKRVSRTIADLDGSENIEKRHLLEALSYRRR
jgi:magnesium chelatase family protein